jgi:NLR family CARD domain-containing protein 3
VSLVNLRTLDLHGNKLGDMGLQVLARWPGLSRLTHLNVRNNNIGELGVKDFIASPYRGSLEHLDVSSNNYGEEVAGALTAACAKVEGMKLHLDPPPAKAAER